MGRRKREIISNVEYLMLNVEVNTTSRFEIGHSIFYIKKGLLQNSPLQYFIEFILSQIYHFYPWVFGFIKHKQVIGQVGAAVHSVNGIHHYVAAFIKNA